MVQGSMYPLHDLSGNQHNLIHKRLSKRVRLGPSYWVLCNFYSILFLYLVMFITVNCSTSDSYLCKPNRACLHWCAATMYSDPCLFFFTYACLGSSHGCPWKCRLSEQKRYVMSYGAVVFVSQSLVRPVSCLCFEDMIIHTLALFSLCFKRGLLQQGLGQ